MFNVHLSLKEALRAALTKWRAGGASFNDK
jgi:hypothetical protein